MANHVENVNKVFNLSNKVCFPIYFITEIDCFPTFIFTIWIYIYNIKKNEILIMHQIRYMYGICKIFVFYLTCKQNLVCSFFTLFLYIFITYMLSQYQHICTYSTFNIKVCLPLIYKASVRKAAKINGSDIKRGRGCKGLAIKKKKLNFLFYVKLSSRRGGGVRP